MATPAASHRSTALQALIVFSVLAVLVAYVGARHHVCHPFSCGALSNVSHPFRRQGDSPHCGRYELVCTATNATIHIAGGTYYVISIDYADRSLSIIDTDLDLKSSCPLPRWDNHALIFDSKPNPRACATFVNCSHEVNDHRYKPVRCMSTADSFIYIFLGDGDNYAYAQNFQPSCGYLAMTPLDYHITGIEDASYEDVVKFMRKGFPIPYPWFHYGIRECLADSMREFREESIKYQIVDILFVDYYSWCCVFEKFISSVFEKLVSIDTVLIYSNLVLSFAMWCLKIVHVLCRFVLVPLAIIIFLAHKYWKTRITMDAIEKFLRMQLPGGRLRFSYTDITAITSHFREKLGHGGYGSVYKGVLHPGNVQVAIKMLSNPKCNGDEFISEVSTIGRIHHVNVVRLLGFCSEEMRRALVYEYMPNGSLEKYIFSPERNFSWDKLNEIALGIARGINYLHQGCDMQILHFDIKPHNILLDHNFVPKVADFGLAKLFPRDNSTVALSAMRGTIGYIAPEMVSRSFGVISSKSDVYSFGMLLLEIAGGRRNADPNVSSSSSQNYYPSWVYNQLNMQQQGEISATFEMHELEKKLCIVGLWCIQMKSQDRPTMSEVIEMLESDINSLELPSRPFFCDGGGELIPVVHSYCLSSGLDDIEEEDE